MSETANERETGAKLTRALGSGYQVRRMVGRGGFAEVYEVWDRELERRLAIKVLRPDIAWTAGMVQRFKQETRAVAKLQHPNILPIHFVGEGEDLVYYAMPYVEGQSLGDQLRTTGALSPAEALDIMVPILEALQHAHQQGLVHRDIKPDNIMIDTATGRPLLVDFGIAKRLDTEGGLTQTGFVVGTPYYMSPEQALGQSNLDARSDLYAFGAVLFQMVTGSPPFDGDSSQEIVGKHLADPPPEASQVNAQVPNWMSQVIIRCLAKTPDERYQSAAHVAQALTSSPQATPTLAADQPAALDSSPEAVDPAAATELVPSEERRSAAMPVPRRRRVALIGLPLLALLSLAAAWALRPRLLLENRLVEPIMVNAGGTEYRVEPVTKIRIPLRGGGRQDVVWTMEQPLNSMGEALGTEVFGALTLERSWGPERRVANASPAERTYFAPLITNNTGRPLNVTVNAGTGAAIRCACTIPADAIRAHVGYYPLYQNSTVRVSDAEGRSAMFTDLGAEVDPSSGVVGLRFEAQDLR
ncbi:MAG: serine/threonine protein kinase [Gemmatimonadota bacterium]|nr:serine/threonine protein kinase [Gemmatimonadota bacterium]